MSDGKCSLLLGGRRIAGHPKVAGPGRIGELDNHVHADAFELVEQPRLTSLLRMAFDFVGRTVQYIHPAAVGFPARDRRIVAVVSIGDRVCLFCAHG